MKKVLPLFFLLMCLTGLGQSITIPQQNDTPENLVNTLLNNACVEVSNVEISSEQSVAYFTNNGGAFPIEEGVMIRTGNAYLTEGPYTDENLSSQVNSLSDDVLEQINQDSGQSSILTDLAFLEFDFVPLSSNFRFNFLFASNEYGQWQCVSSDVFAFLLTNLTTGQTSNLAVVPATNTPVSVKNIKDDTFNNSCSSDNPQLFDTYTVNNPQSSSVNMRGYTKMMTASSGITPGMPYKIRLVIADSNDSSYDSAIFLEAGSFTADVDLGQDKMICEGDVYSLSTGLDVEEYDHSWTYNGQIIPGQHTNSINVGQTGTFGVMVTKQGTNCLISDQINFVNLNYKSPEDIEECYHNSGSYLYDLTYNNVDFLELDNVDYEVHYFNSLQDANNLQPLTSSVIPNYQSSGNETIYIRFYNTVTGNYCSTIDSFNLMVSAPFGLTQPNPIGICTTPGTNPVISLRQAEPLILGPQLSSAYSFTYYELEIDAENKQNEITNVENYEIPLSFHTKDIWVRVESSANTSCYEIVNVKFLLNDPPLVSELNDVVECESYILPNIAHGNYFTSPNGGGQQLPIGYEITKSGTIYIFSGPDQNGCVNQTSFHVAIVKDYSVKKDHCGSFKVPFPPAGEFYTAPGGPNGNGNIIPSGSFLYQNQTIWFYAEVDGVFCREKSFDINILPLPPVDKIEDVVTCNSYTLPPLTHGNYFTKSNGKGQQLLGGQVITSSQKIYIYNDDGTCDNQHSFTVSIVPNFTDLTICGDYELPNLEIGGYYTQPQGQGQNIPEGTVIAQSQTIYYYAETTTLPNCTNNTSFHIEIKPIPQVDSLENITLCEDEGYTLPVLTHGNYYSKANGKGKLYSAGDLILESKKLYIYNEDNGCSNQTSFQIKFREYPKVPNFTDVYICDSYELPEIENGQYFTKPLKQGQQLHAGDFIDKTQTIYLYNEYEDLKGCYNEDSFTIYVEGIKLEEIEDVYACDSYILPELNEGNYYTKSGGEGTKLYPGHKITSNQKIFIYTKNGTRFICESETSFNINITLPTLENFSDIEKCGSHTLEKLYHEGYHIGYYWQTGGKNPISDEELNFQDPGIYTVYIYAEAIENPACYVEKSIEITIYEKPQLYIEGGTICRDANTGEVLSSFYLISGLDPSEFKVRWFLDEQLVYTGSEYEAVNAGEYYVEVEKLHPEIGSDCNYLPTTVTVTESAKPVIEAKVTEPFEDVANISVHVLKGYGPYQYQIDGGAFQAGNEFYNVSSGPHKIVAKGLTGGCGNTVIEVDVIKHPKFFTPNQDGYNDTWNIFDLDFDKNAKVFIYDRFGKLITIIRPSGKGWDGSYHSKNMPSSDYWFVVDYTHNGQKRKYKSHFTLKK